MSKKKKEAEAKEAPKPEAAKKKAKPAKPKPSRAIRRERKLDDPLCRMVLEVHPHMAGRQLYVGIDLDRDGNVLAKATSSNRREILGFLEERMSKHF